MTSSAAADFIKFVNAAVSPFHAVQQAKIILEAAGFIHLSEAEPWKLQRGHKYYYTRNQSSIVAFSVGKQFQSGNGFNIVACHTDSPVLKVKPVSTHSKVGYLQVGVEAYGGGLWHTWFDRDLTVAGRVFVNEGDQYISKLVHIQRPILRVPNLAIHLNRGVNTDGFKFNSQTHLLPMLATSAKAQLGGVAAATEDAKHQPLLLKLLAEQLNCEAANIKDFELVLADTQPACIGGALNEFVFSPRLDNLLMSFCAVQSLVNAGGLDKEENVRMIALFDHEEVGSASAHGAGGTLMFEAAKRITHTLADQGQPADLFEVALRRSFLVSADMAHAIHPNYVDKHEEHHQPMIHKGVVVKTNSNQRYATTSFTALALRRIAERHNLPLQDFVVRNDVACGSTIGPILSSGVGIRTVDVGVPQLSMHSIREMCGTDDVQTSHDLFKAFFEEFTEVDKQIVVDQ